MQVEPRATYRIQLGSHFGFADAAALAGYLADLGISHLYSSPSLASASGTHGYDVVDHAHVEPRLGGAAAHRAMCESLAAHGLAQLVDVVPNHMAIAGRENALWWDVLANGASSRFAAFFDIEWRPPEERMRDRLLLPVLGDHYGRVLEAGELELRRTGPEFVVRYHEREFPISPRTLDGILVLAGEHGGSTELVALGSDLLRLPEATASDALNVQLRYRESARLLDVLSRLLAEKPALASALDGVVGEINADPDALDALLERQNYRLAFWRAADRDLSYRRFFDIDTLIGLRVENEGVFRSVHELVLGWVRDGFVDGLRIDHVDGLRDPQGYLDRLRAEAPDAWLLVEKIVLGDEQLPASWPIDGTTGYEFAKRATGVLIDPSGEAQLTRFHERFTGRLQTFAELVREKKHLVLRDLLGSDVNRLTALFVSVCERHRRHRDYTRHELQELLREVLSCMTVYRTYVRAQARTVSDADVATVEAAITCAKTRRPDLDPIALDFLGDILLLRNDGAYEAELATRFQQLSAPTMAKGVEDTAFYAYARFIALNEVGGEPLEFGTSVEALHRASAETLRCWPRTLLATSTHDTKRSADVRARQTLLSEIPEEWSAAVERWSKLCERHWAGATPDRNVEYILFQTLVGAWPIGSERVLAYIEKACREMKEQTSWTVPNAAYESSVRGFVEGILGDEEFVGDLTAFVAPLVEPGRGNSLLQELLKLTSPGIPDVYQGSELWDLSLVDPDNRRPVDFALRQRLLAELGAPSLDVDAMLARSDEGLTKMWLLRQALALRKRFPEAFAATGEYRPLWGTGSRAQHLIAYVRGERVIALGARLPLRLAGDWQGTCVEIPPGRWRDELTGRVVEAGPRPLESLLARLPVALLVRLDEP